jgi:hypothetical protein
MRFAFDERQLRIAAGTNQTQRNIIGHSPPGLGCGS